MTKPGLLLVGALTIALCGPHASLAVDARSATKAAGTTRPAAGTKPTTRTAAAATRPAADDWTARMDYGPFLQTAVARAGGKALKTKDYESPAVPKFPIDLVPDMVATKGVVIPVGPKGPDGRPTATVCFDAEHLSMSGWTGGWLDLSQTMFTNRKGTSNVTLAGTEAFRVVGLGAAAGRGDNFVNARSGSAGSRPEARSRYKGLYVHGDRVSLDYQVGEASVRETPGYEPAADEGNGGGAFTRTLLVQTTTNPVAIAACDVAGGTSQVAADGKTAVIRLGGRATIVEIERPYETWALKALEGRVWLSVEPVKGPQVGRLRIMHGPESVIRAARPSIAKPPTSDELYAVPGGGPPRWKPIRTKGQLGETASGEAPAGKKSADPAFVVDTLTLPDKNPYHSWFRLSGVDFLPDGRAAVCTINGDVWVVSGIDDDLRALTWTRFATGLYQPMGLCVVDGKVLVRGRDQITRLHDLNGDGEADFYENVSDEGAGHPSYHGMSFDLQADARGNLYYARGGLAMDPNLPGLGRLIRLSPDGRATTLADGLRVPNGLGLVGPGWVTISDNQGNWIPSSKVHLVDPARPAAFLGYLPHHHAATRPAGPVQPLVWIPHKLDTSSGGQAEVPAGGPWGAYAGQWVHTSYGMACAMLMLPDAATPPGQMPKQAAVVRLPLDFATGVMRPRFSPRDGQLYVAGVGGGWQSKGTADGGLYRVRATGKPGFVPTRFALVPGGVRVSFAVPLDKAEAADPQNYAVEQWNYKWTEKYGSPDFSARTPGKAGHDEVEVKSVAVSDDGHSVTLALAELVPVNQLSVQCNLKTAGGAEFEQTVYATVNAVPGKGE